MFYGFFEIKFSIVSSGQYSLLSGFPVGFFLYALIFLWLMVIFAESIFNNFHVKLLVVYFYSISLLNIVL